MRDLSFWWLCFTTYFSIITKWIRMVFCHNLQCENTARVHFKNKAIMLISVVCIIVAEYCVAAHSYHTYCAVSIKLFFLNIVVHGYVIFTKTFQANYVCLLKKTVNDFRAVIYRPRRHLSLFSNCFQKILPSWTMYFMYCFLGYSQ